MSECELLTVIVSYNRLELLQRTVASYQETVTLPHYLLIVDNASGDDTRDWLNDCGEDVLFLETNRYPGYATNRGWATGLATFDPNLLHRSDNDFEYQPGWCDEVAERFQDPQLGQLGLRTYEEEPVSSIGGNSIIRRELWDAGLRYNEEPWQTVSFEDTVIPSRVMELGYTWSKVSRPCAIHTGIANSQDPYYQETFSARNITFQSWGVA